MNTFQLQCFLAVAEYLSFAQAAQHLHVTHPAVSQQIQSLEKELNHQAVSKDNPVCQTYRRGKSLFERRTANCCNFRAGQKAL